MSLTPTCLTRRQCPYGQQQSCHSGPPSPHGLSRQTSHLQHDLSQRPRWLSPSLPTCQKTGNRLLARQTAQRSCYLHCRGLPCTARWNQSSTLSPRTPSSRPSPTLIPMPYPHAPLAPPSSQSRYWPRCPAPPRSAPRCQQTACLSSSLHAATPSPPPLCFCPARLLTQGRPSPYPRSTRSQRTLSVPTAVCATPTPAPCADHTR